MATIQVRPLRDDLCFGARVTGVTYETLSDESVRRQLRDVFEDRGLIVFEDVEPSGKMHVAISNVFSPLKDHPVPSVARVDQDAMPGVIDMRHDPRNADGMGIVEIEGQRLSSWLPWHFDHCYNDELNRAGVLRALEVAPEGGLTRFADGVALYELLSPALREGIEGRNILYALREISYQRMRFGRPRTFRLIQEKNGHQGVMETAKSLPRAVHPAVWTRADGRKVLHLSPWFSVGIEGREDDEGDGLLEAVCQEINANAKACAYEHAWKPSEMVIWDNWRLLHSVSGMDPKYGRRMQRTTIKGDYGLGYFE